MEVREGTWGGDTHLTHEAAILTARLEDGFNAKVLWWRGAWCWRNRKPRMTGLEHSWNTAGAHQATRSERLEGLAVARASRAHSLKSSIFQHWGLLPCGCPGVCTPWYFLCQIPALVWWFVALPAMPGLSRDSVLTFTDPLPHSPHTPAAS